MKYIKIIFSGSDEISLFNINSILKIKKYKIIFIFIKKSFNLNIKKIINVALINNIKLFYIYKNIKKNIININNIIKKYKIDLFIISSLGIIFPIDILKIPKYGFINIHPSLLPNLIGPAPIHWTIIKKYIYTGITIILINKYIDNGEILFRSFFYIKKNESFIKLYRRLCLFSSYAILYILRSIYNNNIIIVRDKCININIKKSYTTKIYKEFYKLNFNENILHLNIKIKLLNKKIKPYFIYKNINIKIIENEIILDKNIKNDFGKIFKINNHGLYIKSLNGIFVIKSIIFPNKNITSIKNIINSKVCIFKLYDYII